MSNLRRLCRETPRRPTCVKALFYFLQENKTGIAPTRLIVEKDVDVNEGKLVTVNWQGKKVPAEILAVNGKYLLNVLYYNCYPTNEAISLVYNTRRFRNL